MSTPVDESALVAAPAALVAAPTTDLNGQVVGRFTFYNHSRFDNYEIAPNQKDNAAIASDKQALLPGQVAQFANYTSFAAGINGVMVDVSGLSGVPTLSDFAFKVGNSNDPGSWAESPAPWSMNVFSGGGVNGSTRIVFVWADGMIKNEWLQVTVRATPRTGLSAPDVFYFGNAVGETGNSPTNAIVNAADQIATRNTPYASLPGAAPITARNDFDRDGLINLSDEIIARTSYNGQGGVLQLIATPAADPGEGFVPDLENQVATPSTAATSSAANAPSFVDFVSTDVVNRAIFYNHSQFDDVNPVANAQDDLAIATGKFALLPGQKASVANYTSYSGGINGIMIDVAGLVGDPTFDDFQFRMGYSDNPSTWATAPQPMSISVRRGAGLGGSDRVTITWPDGVIVDTWLEVTFKSSVTTGLQRNDVFYFGNLVGDALNTGTQPLLTTADQLATRNSPYLSLSNPAPITEVADFNRDQIVNEADEWIARSRYMGVTQFTLITPAAAATVAEPVRPPASFVQSGDNGYYILFNPKLAKTTEGTLLYVASGHTSAADDARIALVMKRSFDNGVTWTPLTTIYSVPNSTAMVGSPSLVVDEVTGEIFVLVNLNASKTFVISSTDDGVTWSAARDITYDVKVTAIKNPNPASFPDTPWGWYVLLEAIQIQSGPYAGRLVAGGNHRFTDGSDGPSWSHVVYSDDHGQTWHLGGGLAQSAANAYSNEISLIETDGGALYMNIRMEDRQMRASSWSYDGGATWTDLQFVPDLTSVRVHGSLVRVNDSTVAFAAPDDASGGNVRRTMTIWLSYDNMQTWVKTQPISYDYASYSDMVALDDNTILLVFNYGRESGDSRRYVSLVRINLRALEAGVVPQFTWNFNEMAPGQVAALNGNSIYDTSLWNNRAVPQANSAAEAPQYVAGPNGGTALRLTKGSDRVELSPPDNRSLQFMANESFTVEMNVRTTDTSGMFIGTRDDGAGWFLTLESGFVRLTLRDGKLQSTVRSSVTINDGNWHQIQATRDTATSRISLRIDGVEVAAGDDTTRSLWSSYKFSVMLGADTNGANQLAFDIDVLRITRRTLAAGEALGANYVEPPRNPATDFGSNAPNTIDGLQLWMPAYDPAHSFGDVNFGDVLAIEPNAGTAVMSMIDASPNQHRITASNDARFIQYAEDPLVGGSFQHDTSDVNKGRPWVVQDSNGTSPTNFDFVQNTGVFTISLFVNRDTNLGSYATLMDTIGQNEDASGFTLCLNSDGSVKFTLRGAGGEDRFQQTTQSGLVIGDNWYQIVIVGSGPGSPVAFYITPVSNSTVASYFGSAITGADGNYPTTADQNLTIGGRAATSYAAFDGNMVDQAIYNRALTTVEIQQLFDYTKKID